MYFFKKNYLKSLYTLTAALRYNGEKVDLLESVLSDLLLNPRAINIEKEAREIAKQIPPRLTAGQELSESEYKSLRSEWFKLKRLLIRGVSENYVEEYIIGKFLPFSIEFEERYSIRWDALKTFCYKFMEYLEFRKHSAMFRDETYEFESMKDYDPGSVKTPDNNFIDLWQAVSTIDIRDLKELFQNFLGAHELDKILSVLTIDDEDIKKESEVNFALKPFVRIDSNTMILLTESYLIKALPLMYEALFKEISAFRDSKGDAFEKLVGFTLRGLPFRTLAFDRTYGRYQIDAILEFEKTNWFVEVKSHPVTYESLSGNPVAIERDLEKSIEKAIAQGKICFQHLESNSLSYFKRNGKKNRILVVLDGTYPQLNPTTAIRFFNEEIPVYIINWFDLRELVEQKETLYFEEFLRWRITDPMPIVCFDEKDYWGYFFDRHLNVPHFDEIFKKSQEKMYRIFYSSPRFNDKSYLNRLLRD